MAEPWLGVVADDLTGACDVAGALASAGCPTDVWLGRPVDAADLAGRECAVVALKSRTAPVAAAVAESAAAARWLLDRGVPRLYQKYCSTFDSTAEGNIGPVADALVRLAAVRGGPGVTVGTPATPAVGRTQYLGHLFVEDRLLSESSLRDHPLTPMRDADLVRVLGRQTPRPVRLVGWPTVRAGAAVVRAAVRDAADAGAGHVLVDALDDGDLDVVAAALDGNGETHVEAGGGPVAVVGGAAGLAAALARRHARPAAGVATGVAATVPPGTPAVGAGRRLVLSGSCSRRTREQVAAFARPVVRLDPFALADDSAAVVRAAVAAVAAAYAEDDGRPALVSATAAPAELAEAQRDLGTDTAAALVERALADVAVCAVDELGVRRLLVAGGETAGAVGAALGLDRLHVGASAAPGVPWMVTAGDAPRLALLLKSGNFGGVDLFSTAWAVGP